MAELHEIRDYMGGIQFLTKRPIIYIGCNTSVISSGIYAAKAVHLIFSANGLKDLFAICGNTRTMSLDLMVHDGTVPVNADSFILVEFFYYENYYDGYSNKRFTGYLVKSLNSPLIVAMFGLANDEFIFCTDNFPLFIDDMELKSTEECVI